MPIQKERLIGKYLPFEPKTSLPPGTIVDGKNMMRRSILGGWTPRKGYTLLNTSSGSGQELLSLHEYITGTEYFLFLQRNYSSATYLYQKTNLTQAATFGSSVFTVGSTPGFSCVIGDEWIYCDGSGAPITYGGADPKPDGLLSVCTATATNYYVDFMDRVKEDVSDIELTLLGSVTNTYYVGMRERGTGVKLTIDNASSDGETLSVHCWQGGSWTAVANLSDGTIDSGSTHAVSGTVSWDFDADDELKIIGNQQLFWYRFTFSDSISAQISAITVIRPMQRMTNKWNGEFRAPLEFMVSKTGVGIFSKLGAVTDGLETTYADVGTTATVCYFKASEPVMGLGLKFIPEKTNTSVATVNNFKYKSILGYTSFSSFEDTTLDSTATKTHYQDGVIWLGDMLLAQFPCTAFGDNLPGYWYYFTYSTGLDAETRIGEVVYAAMPTELQSYNGCAEFQGRLVLWGDVKYPNRLLLSDYARPDYMSNIVERYSPPFGAKDVIKCAIVSGDYLIIYKKRGIYLWDGVSDQPITISSSIGIAGPKTAVLIVSGDKTLKEDEVRSIIIHQAKDGVYKLSLDQNNYLIAKISDQIREYFDPTKTDYIGDSDLTNRQAEYEPVSDTYRLYLDDATLVYRIGTDEWMPPWEYELQPVTGLSCNGPSDLAVMLAGTDEGYLLEMEQVTSDRNSSNTATKIEHEITSRPIFMSEEEFNSITATLREIWTECLEDSGAIVLTLYTNRATTGSALSTPSAPSLAATGYSVVVQRFDLSSTEVNCFQLKFASSTLNQTMEVYSFSYRFDQLLTYD